MSESTKNALLYGVLAVLLSTSFFFIGRSTAQRLGATQRDIKIKSPFDVIGTASSLALLTNSFDAASSTFRSPFLQNLHLDVNFIPYSNNQYLVMRVEVSNDNGTTFYPIATKDITTSSIDIFTSSTNGIPLQWFQGISTVASTSYFLADDYSLVADVIRVSARCNTGANCEAHVRATVESN